MNTSSMHVLVIENEFLIAEDLKDLVMGLGAETTVVLSAAEAAQHLLRPDLKLVIANLHAANDLGIEVYAALKQRGVQMVLCTAATAGEAHDLIGDALVLCKPFTQEQVRALLAQVIGILPNPRRAELVAAP